MEFRILGPLEVRAGSERLDLGGARQQIVLAALLLAVGKVVTVDRLLEAVYGEDLPSTARSQAQMSVSSLRRLFAAHGDAEAISTRAQGYVLQVGEGWLDSRRFTELMAAGGAAREAGHLDLAAASYRDALRLWRGPALEGIDSQLIRAAASRLDEQRIAAIEDRLAVELDLGRAHELVGELAELVVEFPLRQGLHGQLMLALYRCGRTAEALRAYRQARRTMVEELGIEPDKELRQLEHAILTSDPALALSAVPARAGTARRQVPRLLPTDIADFTGRANQFGQIRRHLSPPAGEKARVAPSVVVITGTGGVGKTSLAVHTAHGLAGQFRHGQLFADLHGGGTGSVGPIGPARVLERFLRALGVPGPQIPEGLDERAEMYRNLLAGRRVLVVLDDAASESQVLPLLPGSGTVAVLITSRSRLPGLAGVLHVELDVLDPARSLDLLARIVGTERVGAQSVAAAVVAAQCGHLPLALRVAGARLAARPHWSIGQLAERLADETRRLDELRHGDMHVRPSIFMSYASASEKARCLLRRLALLEAPLFSGWVAAPLLDQPPDEAADLLDDLVGARLVEPAGAGRGERSQYRLHELIRVFARERLAAEEPATERQAALQRALGALLYLAEEAYCRVFGGDFLGEIRGGAPTWPLPKQLGSDPLSWIDRERATLVAAVRQAAQAGLAEMAWGLAVMAATLFLTRAYFDDWQETTEIALEATRKAGNVRGQAAMLYSMGSLHSQLRRFDQARGELAAATRLFQSVDADHGIALVTRNMAFIDRLTGRLDDATTRFEQALAAFRRTADSIAAAWVLQDLAAIKLERRQLDDASELLAEALRLCRMADPGRIELLVHIRSGEALMLAEESASAVEAFERALAVARDIGDHFAETQALQGLGVAKLRQGELGQARNTLQRALELAGRTGERLAGARALLGLAEIANSSGDPAQAVLHARQASSAFREMGTSLDEARALALLSEAHAAVGDAAAAEAASARAAALRVPYASRAQRSRRD